MSSFVDVKKAGPSAKNRRLPGTITTSTQTTSLRSGTFSTSKNQCHLPRPLSTKKQLTTLRQLLNQIAQSVTKEADVDALQGTSDIVFCH